MKVMEEMDGMDAMDVGDENKCRSDFSPPWSISSMSSI